MENTYKLIEIDGQKMVVELRTEKNETDYYVNGERINRFKLLALASRCENEKDAWNLLHIASMLYRGLGDSTFNILYGDVAFNITREFTKTEFYYQRLFIENVKKIFGENASIAENKNDSKNIPDAWITINSEKIPVEVKLSDFNMKALKQLERYINAYSCKKGVAVAKSCSIVLPNNIMFVPFSMFTDK